MFLTHILNTNFPTKFTRMGRSKDFEEAQFRQSSCLTQNKVVDEHKTASVTGYIKGITVFKIFIRGGILMDIYGREFSFTATRKRRRKTRSDDIPPKINF